MGVLPPFFKKFFLPLPKLASAARALPLLFKDFRAYRIPLAGFPKI